MSKVKEIDKVVIDSMIDLKKSVFIETVRLKSEATIEEVYEAAQNLGVAGVKMEEIVSGISNPDLNGIVRRVLAADGSKVPDPKKKNSKKKKKSGTKKEVREKQASSKKKKRAPRVRNSKEVNVALAKLLLKHPQADVSLAVEATGFNRSAIHRAKKRFVDCGAINVERMYSEYSGSKRDVMWSRTSKQKDMLDRIVAYGGDIKRASWG